MAEKQRIKVPADNYGRVYIGMLESPLSAYAKLCYGAMWSFGQESWAAVPSIARRMSVSENTVRKAQAELAEAGWIQLQKDSRGGVSKTWEMVPPTLQLVNPYPSGGEVNPSSGEGSTLHAVKGNKELKQEEKKELKQAPTATISDEDKAIQSQAWTALKAVWSKKNPSTPDLKWPAATMRGWAALLISEAKRLGVPELERRWSNMVNDPWVKASLRAFIMDTDKWITLRTSQASGGNARQFHQPTVTEHAPSLKVPPHE